MGVVEPIILQKVKLYKALKQDDKAFAEVQRLIDAHPKDITYLILLGDLYLIRIGMKMPGKYINMPVK